MKNGSYCGWGSSEGMATDVRMEVRAEITDGRLAALTIVSDNSNGKYHNLVEEQLIPSVLAQQSLGVDAVSGATCSSAALLHAVSDCVRQAGGDPADYQKRAAYVDSDVPAEIYECDVAVIGGGAAGTAAAVVAAEKGHRVIVLEKTSAGGGQILEANLLLAADHPMQTANGVHTTAQDVFNEIMNWNHWRGNSRLVSKFVNKTADTIDWLMAHGVPIAYRGSLQESHIMDTGLHFDTDSEGKERFMRNMLESIREHSGEILYNTPAKKFLYDETGRMTGILCRRRSGELVQVNCRAAVIATGGYASNKEMAKKYFKNAATYVFDGDIFTGDGINMAWDAGADEDCMGVRILHCTFPDRKLLQKTRNGVPTVAQFCRIPALMLVNMKGDRFMDEYKLLDSGSCAVAIVAQGDDGHFWSILNQHIVDQLRERGAASLGVTASPGGPGGDYLGEDYFRNIDDDIQEAIQVGLLYRADTPEELAELTGMQKDRLMENLKRYNELCREGKDRDFFKKPSLLHEISGGPYYAALCEATCLGSIGGVRIDDRCRIVDQKGWPIPGIYCAGADAGGIWETAYGVIEGATAAWAFSSGRIAGESVSEYLEHE